MSVRKIDKSYCSLTGAIYSHKNSRQIYFESSLERDFIEILEFDDNVMSYSEQPSKILFDNRKYHPDFFVRYTNEAKAKLGFSDTYFEVKYSEELEKKAEYYEEKFKRVKETLEQECFNFRIVTEYEIRSPFLDNIKFLNHYRFKEVNPFVKTRVLELFQLNELLTPESIVNEISGNFNDKGHTLFVIWYLVSNKIIHSDLNRKLTNKSELWTNYYGKN